MYPSSPLGKFFAGLIAIWGIVMIALPVAIIGSNFAIVYAEEEQKSVIIKEYQKDLDQEQLWQQEAGYDNSKGTDVQPNYGNKS